MTNAVGQGAPSIPVGDPPGRPVRATGLPPANVGDLLERAGQVYQASGGWNDRQDVLGGRWSTVDIWARLILAVTASLSAVSLLGSSPVATGVFAVTTAVVSAANAALDPAGRAAQHRRAAREFRHVLRRSVELQQFAQPEPGREDIARDDPKVFASLGNVLVQLENDMDAALDAAPPLNRLLRWTGTPRTRWGVRRLERQYARQVQAERIRMYMFEADAATEAAIRQQQMRISPFEGSEPNESVEVELPRRRYVQVTKVAPDPPKRG